MATPSTETSKTKYPVLWWIGMIGLILDGLLGILGALANLNPNPPGGGLFLVSSAIAFGAIVCLLQQK